ncbi:GGDEF domain-containing protein [Vibrio sp. SCSIO 43136]|uniref:GGDEF domain-containing protein n=1 Tax=Vibrio sp. SCSIO 43136 TaxID=2819101 RepID=UPI002075AB7B|nr:GGDEF domain-containing protein [Vibrio sp. SCSIO 43136]USD66469.1 GGDEF domain-containing protein [Vibrio sp. SCSIO 43136]
MPTDKNERDRFLDAIRQAGVVSLSQSTDTLPADQQRLSLPESGMYCGVSSDLSPQQQLNIREVLDESISALGAVAELSLKYATLKRDFEAIIEKGSEDRFEQALCQNLHGFVGDTEQFGVLKEGEPVFVTELNNHTVQVVSLQLKHRDELSTQVSRGELYAFRSEQFTLIVQRTPPLTDTQKNHIKLTIKHLSLLSLQKTLSKAMAILFEDPGSDNLVNHYEKETSLQQSLDNLVQCASIDPLTMVYNRRYLMRHVEKLEHDCCAFSLILIDIDWFKRINDQYGHDVGDEVLQEFSQILKTHCRATDTLCRWGGEEFLVVLKGVDVASAVDQADRLRLEVEKHKFVDNISVSASFGVAASLSNPGFLDAVRRADTALYQAKHLGRNRVEQG